MLLRHVVILSVGAFFGLCVSRLFDTLEFDFTAEIAQARAMGIVSVTTLSGHAQARDTLTYISFLVWPLLCAGLPWLYWSRRNRCALSNLMNANESTFKAITWKEIGLVLLFLWLFSFNVNKFYMPYANEFVGSYPMLVEEGVMTHYAQRLMDGQVYGKDFNCIYGPLLTMPVAFVFKVFGASLLSLRLCSYLFDLISYGIVALILLRHTSNRTVAFGGLAFYLIVFGRIGQLGLNSTPLRFVLGLLPIMLLAEHLQEVKSWKLWIAGLLSGVSLQFSQEAGLCALIAVATMIVVDGMIRGPKQSLRNAATFVLAFALSLAPLMTYLAWHNALADFLQSYVGSPRAFSLGFAALPFPRFRDFLTNPLSEIYLPYWIMASILASTLTLLPRLWLRAMNNNLALKLGITLYAALLFRVALGRSDANQTLKVFHATLLLAVFMIDEAVATRKQASVPKLLGIVKGTCWGLSLLLLLTSSPPLRSRVVTALVEVTHPHRKHIRIPSGVAVPEIPRLGVSVLPEFAATLRGLKAFLDQHPKATKTIYFFPNEPLYYFLFNRHNPTRFEMSFHAATKTDRENLRQQLDAARPRFVILSPATFRTDNIPASQSCPEVAEYILSRYRPHRPSHGFIVMERK